MPGTTTRLVFLSCWLAAGWSSLGASPVDRDEDINRMVGSLAPTVRATDVETGEPVAFEDLRGSKATVIVFTGIQCPIGDLYMPRLVDLEATYRDRGVAFLAINANVSETLEQVRDHARKFSVPFRVLKDSPESLAADRLQAERTCEVLVIDADGRVCYRGAIDDQYSVRARRDEPVRHYLSDALEAILAGRPVPNSSTSVFGCPIERGSTAPRPSLPRIRPASESLSETFDRLEPPIDPETIGPVTYAEHVAPIVQERCQSCHRPGQVAPFSLLTYEDARRWAVSIREVVENRRMPPWHADPRYGHFENDRHLSPRERATLIAWADQDAPRGDASREPAPRSWPEGWTIGTPDVVFSMPEPYTVKADGALPYQHFRVKTHFTEDRWVRAIEPRPGDRAVVHHIIIYLENPSGKKHREHLAAYAPGDIPSIFPPGSAKKIPAGSDLIFELHYTPVGKIRFDQSSVGMIFADSPPESQVVTAGIVNNRFRIPPHDPNFEVKSRQKVPSEVRIVGLFPHMHLRGKDFQFILLKPDGSRETLLSVPAYDFAWQSYYRLKEPMTLAVGSEILCVAHFDNSSANPANPDPSVEVRWGEQTWEEMMIGYVDYLVPVRTP